MKKLLGNLASRAKGAVNRALGKKGFRVIDLRGRWLEEQEARRAAERPRGGRQPVAVRFGGRDVR